MSGRGRGVACCREALRREPDAIAAILLIVGADGSVGSAFAAKSPDVAAACRLRPEMEALARRLAFGGPVEDGARPAEDDDAF